MALRAKNAGLGYTAVQRTGLEAKMRATMALCEKEGERNMAFKEIDIGPGGKVRIRHKVA